MISRQACKGDGLSCVARPCRGGGKCQLRTKLTNCNVFLALEGATLQKPGPI